MATTTADIPLIDHHCHSIVSETRKGDAEALLRVTSEAPSTYPLRDLLERPIWHAVLEYVSRYTGRKVTSYDDVASVLAEADYQAYCQALFQDAGYEALYVDTGFAPREALGLKELGEVTGTRTYPVLRLESVAEAAYEDSSSFADWWEHVRAEVSQARVHGYIGGKSIAAYRCGLGLHKVSEEDAKAAYAQWKASGSPRLTSETLLNFLVWESAPLLAEQSLPLQFHTGYGDPDTDLRLGNPLHMKDFIETFTPQGLSVVLLHTYPYQREAGFLASVYEGVYFDTSLILPLGLSASRRVVAEALELAPYSRFLFASDAHTRPEMFAVAAELYRDAFEHHMQSQPLSRFTSVETHEYWAQMVFHDNAHQLYQGR
ncbi:amidohydrolase family protein [Alicyclobacillus ferrooxydans]|uniref:Amidohydrolase-related domain-containing protein n=1 Tax=Alicyclobacillus ferrooxydans TaxID=471514 RepID=A0A0N8PNZ4_9BACL|nr:amidohydrolase family protein [Alicyclobacillus ferrooxydans]KPV42893.1 hypothetical protein AN477_15275 [Alicyclobacillus ferrooxydans]